MNKRRVLNILGKIVLTEICLMIPSLLVSLYYRDGDAMYFLYTMFPAALLGIALCRVQPKDPKLTSRDGYCIVAYGWIVISLIGAVPLFLTGQFRSYFGALFEIVSGFTTTGASVLAKPENLPHGVLFWRSFTHWIGGMGVLVFVLMIIPMKNDNSMHLMRAEVPGPTAGKLVPRMKRTSMILYGIYTFLTVVLVILLLCGGVGFFDSLCLSFGTAGTGGFAPSSAGIAGYGSAYVEIVLGIFMILFGINFNVYYLILLGRIKDALRSEEVRYFLGIILAATAAITINIFSSVATLGTSFRHAFFQVSSIITTTGFATVDFNLWPEFSKHTLVLLMIIGACAGSTTGGIKCIRMVILFQVVKNEFKHILHPNAVLPVRVNKQVISPSIQSTVLAFTFLYAVIAIISILIMMGLGVGFLESIGTVISSMGNMGPGLGTCGPAFSWSQLPDAAKWLLSFLMLLGRLELFTVLLLFTSDFWKKN